MQNFTLLILMVGAVAVMMVFSSRNKKKQIARAAELQQAIVPGTRVMTTSGMHATVTAIAADTIELEIAPGVFTTWIRAAVREVVVAGPQDTEFEDSDYERTEFDDADYAELSGQEIEPIHDDRPSLEKRTNDLGLSCWSRRRPDRVSGANAWPCGPGGMNDSRRSRCLSGRTRSSGKTH